MEAVYDDLQKIVDEVQAAAEKWENAREQYQKLMKYYFEGDWMQDFELSNSKDFPPIKCGILSEDALYDFYGQNRELSFKVMRTALDYLEK